MPKETKTDTKTEAKPATVKVVRDTEWFTSRTVNTQAAIDTLESDSKRMRMQTLLDEVESGVDEDGVTLDDKERLSSYTNLKVLDGRFGTDSIKNVRSSDPHKQSYQDHSERIASSMINSDADFTQFAPLRKTAKGAKTLTLSSIVEYLAGKWQDNNKYDAKADYSEATTEEPEVETQV